MNYNTLLNDQFDIEVSNKKKTLSTLKTLCKNNKDIREFIEIILSEDDVLKPYLLMFIIDFLMIDGIRVPELLETVNLFIEKIRTIGFSIHESARTRFKLINPQGTDNTISGLLELAKINHNLDSGFKTNS